jgi:hypothetical protein
MRRLADHEMPALHADKVWCGMNTRLEEIEARVNAATEGPWQVKPGDFVSFLGEQFFQVLNTKPDVDGDLSLISANRVSLENAEFIAHARTDVPYLLELCKSLEAEVKALREGVEPWADDEGFECGFLIYESLAKADAIAKEREEGLG